MRRAGSNCSSGNIRRAIIHSHCHCCRFRRTRGTVRCMQADTRRVRGRSRGLFGRQDRRYAALEHKRADTNGVYQEVSFQRAAGMIANKPFRWLPVLFGLFILGACTEETPSEVGDDLLPSGEVRTFEVVLDPAQWLTFDTTFSGYANPRNAS